MFWLRKPCLQRMSTLGVLLLIGKLSPQPKRSSRPIQSPHWSCTLELTLMGLHQLQSELVEKSGDVLHDRQSPNTSMTGKPGENRPCSSQNASSMTGDYTHLWTIHLPLFTCSAEHAPHSHVQDTSSHLTTWSVHFMREKMNLTDEPYCPTLAFPCKREAHLGTILFPVLGFLTQGNGS